MPELILDQKKCLTKIYKMAGIAKSNHLTLRPHCKTRQSARVAFPFDPGQVKNLVNLGSKCNMSILLDHPDALPFLKRIKNF